MSLCKAVCSAPCLQGHLLKKTEFDAIIHFEQKANVCILEMCCCNECHYNEY